MKIYKLINIALLVIANAGLHAQEVYSLWTDKTITVDGNPAEWPQQFRYYDGNTKLQFSVMNNATDLYLCVKVTDEQAQRRILRAGMNVWVDPKGKKKENTGVGFPLKQERKPGEAPVAEMQNDGYGMQRKAMIRMQHTALTSQTVIKILGFTGISDQFAPLQNTTGVSVAFNWDSLDILCIEYKMPLSPLLQHSPGAADTVKPMQLGFVVNGLDIPRSSSNDDQSAGSYDATGNPNMRGGMNNGPAGTFNNPNGGMGGLNDGTMQSPPANSSSNNPLTQDLKVWSKLRLSWKAQ